METDNDLGLFLQLLPFTIEEKDNFLIRYFKLLCNIGTIVLVAICVMLVCLLPIIYIIYWANKLLG